MVYQKTSLENRLRVVSSEVTNIHSVSVCVFVGAGSRYELPQQSGISHFVEHLLFKGTPSRPGAKEISEAIEGVGGVLNGGTDKEMTVYWAKVARPHAGLAFDVLADMVRHSIFDPVEVEKERQVIIEEINMSMDSPQQRVSMLIDEAIWPNQTLGRDVAGTKETVGALIREGLFDYHTVQYVPECVVISVAGDIAHGEVVDLASAAFGDWSNGSPGSWFPVKDGRDGPNWLVEPKETELSHLCLAVKGISSSHPDRFAFDLLNMVLGGGMSSRLFLELREKKALVYDIHSYVSHLLDSGCLTIYAGVEPKNIEAAVETVLGELAKLKTDNVPEEELRKAKEMAKGRLLLGMEDTRSISGWIGSQELLRGEIITIDEMVDVIEAITVEDLKKVAGEWFRTEGLSFALVGPKFDEDRIRTLLTL